MDKNLRNSPARLAAQSERKSPNMKKSPGRPKSPGRTKSPARPKSPARTKSPGRTKSDEKKPRAKSKSPSRKVAAPKESSPKKRQASKSPSRTKAKLILTPIDSQSPDIIEVLRRSRERSAAIEEIRMSQERNSRSSAGDSVESSSTTLRRSARVKSSLENDGMKPVTEKIFKANHIASAATSVRREFGGWPGALLFTIALPVALLVLQLSCLTKERCKPQTILTPPLNWKYYLDLNSAQWYAGFIALQVLLSLLPLSRKKTGIAPKMGPALEYRCSGFVIALISLSVVGGLQYFKFPVSSVLPKTVSLLVMSIIFGLVLSIALFIKGGRPHAQLNPKGNTGNLLYDFWIGREINPRLGPIDFKQLLVRTAVVESLIYDSIILWKAVENKAVASYPPTIVVMTALQIFSFLDFLWNEDKFLASFHIQHEGTGYMTVVASCVWPFAVTFIPKYLLFNSIETNVFVLPVIVAFFMIGYVIYRMSNNQKSRFRNDPLDPSLASIPTIPTVPGKKLLCGGWWGKVRHPNYSGSIIMYWAYVAGCGLSHWSPYAVPLAMTVLLVHRAMRDNSRCRSIYTGSWERYVQKVKYHLIPKVF